MGDKELGVREVGTKSPRRLRRIARTVLWSVVLGAIVNVVVTGVIIGITPAKMANSSGSASISELDGVSDVAWKYAYEGGRVSERRVVRVVSPAFVRLSKVVELYAKMVSPEYYLAKFAPRGAPAFDSKREWPSSLPMPDPDRDLYIGYAAMAAGWPLRSVVGTWYLPFDPNGSWEGRGGFVMSPVLGSTTPDFPEGAIPFTPLWMGVMLNSLVYASGVLLLFACMAGARAIIRSRRIGKGLCPKCKYPRTGSASPVCVECGFVFEGASGGPLARGDRGGVG